jgi:hypothetical protein
MNATNSFEPQIQFSIYKVNIDKVEETFKLSNKDYENYIPFICDLIVNSIISLVSFC